jgi:NADH-quinone oxidoreductase subunit N
VIAFVDAFPLELVRPEAALTLGLFAILASDLVQGTSQRRVGPWLGIVAAAVAFALSLGAPSGAVGTMLSIDPLAQLARLLILPLLALLLLAGVGERRHGSDSGAWSASVVAVGLGALVAAAAANFVTLWLGLELLALAGYTLVAFRGGDRRAAEAGMKFVLFGGTVSGVMLFGISHVYGATGHLDFAGIGQAFANGAPAAAGIGLLLAGAGVAYKLTLVPLHFYAPDVYQGSPALGVATVSTLPKIAAATALMRFLAMAVPAPLVDHSTLAGVIAVLAAASMLFASFTALVQRDAKRIVAFSGIGHGAAVVLAAACLPAREAAAAAGFYLLTYVGSNAGALVCLSVLERSNGSTSLQSLAGSWRQHPLVSSLLCLFLLSLAGVPPLAGFLGKWGVLQQAFGLGFASAVNAPVATAALLFLAATAVSAWSYLLIVRAVVFAEPASGGRVATEIPVATKVVLAVSAAATLGIGLWLDGLATISRAL